MFKKFSNSIKYRIIILSVVCLAISILWPGLRADLRACNGDTPNGYGYDYNDTDVPNDPDVPTDTDQGTINVDITVNPCATPPIEGLAGGPYAGITVIGSDQFSFNTVDPGSFSVAIEVNGEQIPLSNVPPSAWMLEGNNLTLYFNLAGFHLPEELQATEATVNITGEILLGEMLSGTTTVTTADFGACEEEPSDPQDNSGVCYEDFDKDGFGNPDKPLTDAAPEGCVSDNTDCDDTDPDIHPSATDDTEDSIDQNCDGTEGPANDGSDAGDGEG